jgi:hypothetical protein
MGKHPGLLGPKPEHDDALVGAGREVNEAIDTTPDSLDSLVAKVGEQFGRTTSLAFGSLCGRVACTSALARNPTSPAA